MKEVIMYIILFAIIVFNIRFVLNAPAESNLRETSKNDVQILELENVINDNGSFNYKSILDDGSLQDVNGVLKEDNNGTKFISVTGTYSYIMPTGEKFTVTYVADENGYNIKSITQTLPGEHDV